MNDGKQSRLTGLLRLRHLGEVSEAKAEEMASEAAQRFDRLADPASAPRVVSAFNLFQTPEPLAARLAGLFGPELGRTLEPSAGLGRLYRAVRARSPVCPVTLIDIEPACCRELYLATAGDENATLFTGDFLTMTEAKLGRFDSIIMNPPFKNGADIKHINHARTLLDSGGKLVALCAAGPRQRRALEPICDQWIDLPANSFAEVGTHVSAAIVVFTKGSDLCIRN